MGFEIATGDFVSPMIMVFSPTMIMGLGPVVAMTHELDLEVNMFEQIRAFLAISFMALWGAYRFLFVGSSDMPFWDIVNVVGGAILTTVGIVYGIMRTMNELHKWRMRKLRYKSEEVSGNSN